MRNLIRPMGGKSSRFPEMRPKWMLTHPSSGSFMCIESIKGINLDFLTMYFLSFLKNTMKNTKQKREYYQLWNHLIIIRRYTIGPR